MESAHTEKITRPLGAAFRSNTLKKLDGRTKTARRLREIISELTEHCGGVERVSAAQRYLIERTAIDILRLEALGCGDGGWHRQRARRSNFACVTRQR